MPQYRKVAVPILHMMTAKCGAHGTSLASHGATVTGSGSGARRGIGSPGPGPGRACSLRDQGGPVPRARVLRPIRLLCIIG